MVLARGKRRFRAGHGKARKEVGRLCMNYGIHVDEYAAGCGYFPEDADWNGIVSTIHNCWTMGAAVYPNPAISATKMMAALIHNPDA